MFKYLILLILISCVPQGGNITVGPGSQGAIGGPGVPGPDIFTIAVVDHQLIINGRNFAGITHVTLKDPTTGIAKPFAVKIANLTKLISDSIDTMSVPLNKGLDLILSNAYGQTTYPVTFTLQNDAVAEGHIQDGAVTRLKLNKEPGDTPGDGDVLVWNAVDGQFDFAPYSAGGGGGGVVSITRGVGIANTGTTISVSGPISVDVGVTGAPPPLPGSPTLSKIPFFNNNNKIVLDSSLSAAGQITGLNFKDGTSIFDIYNDGGFLDILNEAGTRIFSLDNIGDLKLKGSSVCTQATGCSGVGPGAGVTKVTAALPLGFTGTTDVIINAGAVNTANNLVQLDVSGGLPGIVFGPGKAQRHQTYLDNLGTLNPNANYMIIGNGSSWAVQGGDTLLTSIGAQKADSDLSSLSGLSPALGNIIVGASATWTTSTIPNCGASGNVTLSNGTSFSCSGNLSPISAGTLTTFGQGVQIKASASPGELHFFGINNSNYVGLKAADATASDTIWTLPPTDGAAGSALITDGAGTLAWVDVGGGNDLQILGPSTDKAIARFKGDNAKEIQNSAVFISDNNDISGVKKFTSTGDLSVDGSTLSVDSTTHRVGVGASGADITNLLTLPFATNGQGLEFNDISASNTDYFIGRAATHGNSGLVIGKSSAKGVAGDYSFMAGNDGSTYINAASGKTIHFKNDNGLDRFSIDSTGAFVPSGTGLRFSDGIDTVTLLNPPDITSPYILRLPAALPGTTQALVSDSFGQLSWGVTGGDVAGPASSTMDDVVTFDGVSGKLIKDSGIPSANLVTKSSPFSAANRVVLAAGTSRAVTETAYKLPLASCPNGQILKSNGTDFSCGTDLDTGDVVGAASPTAGNLPEFADGTGKLLADSGIPSADVPTMASASGMLYKPILSSDSAKGLVAAPYTFPNIKCPTGFILKSDLSGNFDCAGDDNTGNVRLPGSSTDKAIVRFLGNNTKDIQNSGIIISDGNDISGVAQFSSTGTMTVGGNSFFVDTVNDRVGIGTATPTTSAILDLNSTNKGFLPPRMDTTARNGIVSPANGLLIYNSETNTFNARINGTWETLTGDVYGPASSIDGNVTVFSGTTGNVIRDSLIKSADLVTMIASATTGNFLMSTGGKVAADSSVKVSDVPTMAAAAASSNTVVLSEGADKKLKTTPYTIPPTACAPGEILKADGVGNFICGADSNTAPPVTSVFSRTGDVVAMPGDYFSDQISSTPTVNISANTVKGALDEIYAEKLSLTGGNMTGTIFTNSPIVSTAQDAFELGPFGASGGNTGEIRFMELSGSEYVGFKAPDAIASTTIWTLPATKGASGDILTTDGNKNLNWNSLSSLGIGDVVGPGSSVDNNVALFSGTTGKLIKDSGILISNIPIMATPAGLPNRVIASGGADKTLIDSGILFSDLVIALTDFTTPNRVALGGPGRKLTETAYTIPATDGTATYVLKTNGSGVVSWAADLDSGGDVDGPATSTDGNVTVFANGNGKIIRDSGIKSIELVTMSAFGIPGNILVSTGATGAADSTVKLSDVPTMLATGATNTVVLSGGVDKSLKTTSYTFPTGPCGADKVLKTDGSGNFDCVDDVSGVISFNGRSGVVTPTAGDYFSDQISSTPTTNISANNVKGALDEIYAEKLSLTGGNMTGTIFTNSPIVSTAQDAFELGPFGASGGNTGEIRFMELVGSNYVGFKAPDAIASTTIWTLPATQGVDGDILTTDGLKNLNWNSPASLGIGDVVGPATATDGNLASFDGSGKLIQDSNIASANVVTMNLPAQAANRILTSAAANKVAIDTGVLIDGSNNVTGTNAFTSSGNMTVGGTDFFVNTTSHQVGMGTATPNASALLDLTSTTKALLLPRMTTVQRDAIGGGSPTDGLLIYNTTLKTFNGRIAGNWEAVTGDVYGPDISTAGNVTVFSDASGKIIADSGIQSMDLVTMTASTTMGNILISTGGKGAADSFLNISDVPTMFAVGATDTVVLSGGTDKSLKTTSYTFPPGPCPQDKILKTDASGNFKCVDDLSGVISFNTRTGPVVSITGDYTADMIPITASVTFAATNTQGALEELDALKLALAGGTMTGRIDTTTQDAIRLGPTGVNTGEIQFKELSGTNYAGFKAPDALGADIIWTLPDTAGASGTFLTTDGLKNLNWNSPSSLGIGDVVGPGTATDGNLASFDGSGKLIQDSNIPSANVVTMSSAALGANRILTSQGANKVAIDTGVLIDVANNVTGVLGFTSSGNMTVGGSAFFGDSPVDQVGIGTTTPNASALLDLTSTTKALLLPRMTTAQRDAIGGGSPTDGLLIYNTTLKTFNGRIAGNWEAVTGDVYGPDNSTPGNVPVFSDASGKIIADSGIPSMNLVTMTASATDGNILTAVGGKGAADSFVNISDVPTMLAAGATNTVVLSNGGKSFKTTSYTFPTGPCGADKVLKTDGSGNFDCVDDLSGVISFNGRSGVVTPTAGDYFSDQISSTPTTNISANTVKGALDEIYAEKLSLTGGTMTGTIFTNSPIVSTAQDAFELGPFGAGPGNTGEIRFMDLAKANYVGFKAPDDITSSLIWTLPAAAGTTGTILTTNGNKELSWNSPSSLGIGDVVGPSSSTQFAIAKYSDTTGKKLLDSKILISPTNDLSGVVDFTSTGDMIVGSNALFVDSSGTKVGIGKAGPVQTLDVNGTAAISSDTYIGGSLGISGLTTFNAGGSFSTFPIGRGTPGQYLSTNGFGVLDWADAGDVVGPASSASETLVAFDGTSGKLIKDSGIPYKDVVTMTLPGAGDYVLHSTVGLKTATESNILISDIPTFSAPVGSTNTVVLSAGSGNSLKTTTYTIPSTACANKELLIADASGNFQCGEDTGGVVAFNGRTGIVTPTATDYTAIMIANTASGTISATNAQDAINELNVEKLSLTGGNMTGTINSNAQIALQLNRFSTGTGNTGEIRFEDLGGDGLGYVGFKAPDDVPSGGIIWTLPKVPGLIGQFLTNMGGEQLDWTAIAGGVNGIGDVMGPASSSTNSIPKFADNSGKKLSNSGILISPGNDLSGVVGFISSGDMRVATNTFFVDSNANSVGIGNSAPIATLDVTGTAAISNNATIGGTLWITGQTTFNVGTTTSSTFPTDRGALGQFLSTDGNGTLSWAAGNLGDVVGAPTSATGNVPVFSDNSGKVIADSNIKSADLPTMAIAATGTYRPIVSAGSNKTQMSLGYSIPNTPCLNGQILKSNAGNLECADDVSGVTSFNTRIGAVFSEDGDYSANMIPITGAVFLATNTQGALNELDAEKLALAGGTMTGQLKTSTQNAILIGKAAGPISGELRFEESGGTEYVGFKAPADASGNIIWTLPAASGASGDILTTNGGPNVLNWSSPSSLGIGDVVALSSSTDGHLVSYDGTTGKVIEDSGIVAANVVTNPSTATDTSIPRFSGPSGKIIQGSSVLVSATNDVSGIVNFTSTGNMTVGGTDFFVNTIQDQVGIGTAAPNISAILDLNSSTKGFLPPRMTTGERNAIIGAVDGLMVYNSTTKSFNGMVNGTWQPIAGDFAGPASSTDNAISRFDGTTGKLVQNSGVVIDDTDAVGNVTNLIVNGNQTISPTNGWISIQESSSSGSATAGNLYFEGPGRNNGWNINNNRASNRLEFYYMPGFGAWTHRVSFDGENNRVGIGVVAPAYTLDVGGTLGISGQTTFNVGGNALTFPTSTGTPGQFLRTDGIGTLSWASGNLGDVVGPATSTTGTLASFSSNTGKLIQDSGIIAANVPTMAVAATGTYRPIVSAGSNKTLMSLGYSIPNTPCTNGQILKSDASGNFTCASDTGGVTLFNGRSGVVTPTTGDYTASQITNVAGGSVAATTAQGAINELDVEKLALAGGTMTGILTTAAPIGLKIGASATSTGDVQFLELTGNGSNYVGFKAPNAITSDVIWTLPAAAGASGTILTTNGAPNVLSWSSPSSLSIGDVVGPSTATDNAIARFDGTGKLIQNSSVIIDDNANILASGFLSPTFTIQSNSASAVNSGQIKLLDSTGAFGYILQHDTSVEKLKFIAQTAAGTFADKVLFPITGTTVMEAQGNVTILGNLALGSTSTVGNLKFYDQDNSHYVALQAPVTVTANPTWTLPAADGASGTMLATNGSGTLSWAAITGGTGGIGNVVGPATSTTGTLASFSSNTGKLIQDSGIVAANVVTNATATTDNAIARFDLATGKLIQGSSVLISDTNDISGIQNFTVKGTNTNTPASLTSSIDFMIGRTNTGGLASGQSSADLAFEYGGSGYKHYITTTHNGVASSTQNSFRFYLNNGVTAGASSAPGTNNILGLAITPVGVGILNATPTEALDVRGNARLGSDTAVGNLKFYDQDSSHYVALQAPVTVTGSTNWTLPAADGSSGQVLATNGGGILSWVSGGVGGIGNVVGPGSSTDNAIARFDLGTGKLIQNSGVIIDDADNVTGIQNLTVKGTNSNTPSASTAALNLMIGRNTGMGLSSGQTSADIALEFGGTFGYKHYISSTHTGTANTTGNSINFYINNGAQTVSTQPGTGNVLALGITPVGVGVLNTTPTEALDVRGNIKATGQAYSTVYNNAALTTFNFNNGNVQYTSASCQAITLQNMVDGGSYQVVIQGTTSGTCTFSHTGVTSVRYAPANGVTTGGSHSVYSLTKVGAIVYVSWITGFL